MTRVEAFLAACPLAPERWAAWSAVLATTLARKHGQARRRQRGDGQGLDLLAWGQDYLPAHFTRPPSNLHRWLAEELDAMRPHARLAAERARAARLGQIDHRHAGLRSARRAGRRGSRTSGSSPTPGTRPAPPGEPQGRIARQPAAGRGLSAGGRAGTGVAQPARSCSATAWPSRLSAPGSASAAGAAAPIAPRSSSATTCRTTATCNRPCSASTREAGSTAR